MQVLDKRTQTTTLPFQTIACNLDEIQKVLKEMAWDIIV